MKSRRRQPPFSACVLVDIWPVDCAVKPQDWQGKDFLDRGKRSLERVRRNLSPFPMLQVMRASTDDLVFEDRFDFAFSIGVIDHLEHPERALARMVAAGQTGRPRAHQGLGREDNRWLVSVLDPLRRLLSSRLPIGVTHHLSLYPTILVWLLVRLGVRPIEYSRFIGSSISHICGQSCSTRCCAHRPLQATGDGGKNDVGGGARGCQAHLGQPDVVVGHRHTSAVGRQAVNVSW
jgi:Methyltransferase domain